MIIVIDTEENDDWLKSFPSADEEIRIHEELAKKYAQEEQQKVQKHHRRVIKPRIRFIGMKS